MGGASGIWRTREVWRIVGPILAVGATATSAHAQCQYDVTVIQAPTCPPPLEEPPATFGTGLNELGQVVGYHRQCDELTLDEAFIWSPAMGMVTLPRAAGVFSARAIDINDAGQLGGTMSTTQFGFVAYLYDNGTFTELPPAPGGAWSMASAINNAGQIVGYRSIGAGVNPFNAFIWSASDGFIDLGLMDDVQTSATDINDQSKVVGWRGLPAATDEAFLWASGEMTTFLGPIPGGFTSVAGGVNNSGQIIVTGLLEENGETLIRSFLWLGGQFTDLGVLPGFDRCTAVDVNDSGQVIGVCDQSNNPNNDVPFVWQGGIISELSVLIADDGGLQFLRNVSSINNAGQIAGRGIGPDGFVVAALLTPVNSSPGDINRDCVVDVLDLIELLTCFGQSAQPPCNLSDVDGSGVVNVLDLIILLLNFGS